MLRYSLMLLFLIFSTLSKAQSNNDNVKSFVFSSPSGNYILLNLDGKEMSNVNAENILIEKSEKGRNNFSKLSTFGKVNSYNDFEKMVGKELAVNFKSYIKAKTNDEVILFLKSNRDNTKYGFFILDIDFLRAIGIVYLDEMAQAKSSQYEYRLTQNGKILKQGASELFNKNDLPKGKAQKLLTTDSIVSIHWMFNDIKYNLPLLARIYKQDNGKGLFKAYPDKIAINNIEGKLTAFHEERSIPEHLASYYIVPVDMFGNEGNPSDTVSSVTVDFKKIPGIQNVTIIDSLDGLLCQWKALPAKPYYTGIQILRSRDAVKDFIVLDSLSFNSTSYLDKQVLPNVTYFYKFRPIVYKLSGWEEIIATSFHGTKGSPKNAPLPPKNLEVYKVGNNVSLKWDANQELDLFAYFVLRGTSSSNMVIVSPAILETKWVDSTINLSGRTNYVYSILAMNNSQVKSNISNTAGIIPDRGEFIEAPAGISIRSEGEKVILNWPDVKKSDVAIAGYVLYKRKKSDKEFLPLKPELIFTPFYEDSNCERNEEYVYEVSAVDRFGYESSRSPQASFTLTETISPPTKIYVRKLSTGVEISWPESDNADIFYNVYRRSPEINKYVKLGSAKSSEGKFIDKKFLPGKLNIYAITISTKFGESEKSIEKTVFVEK